MKYKKILERFYKSTVCKNFISLSFLKFTGYFFPLITVPYISRIFGPEIFGLINFASSFTSYFLLIVNYGFELSASREIAQNRDDKNKIEIIFNEVIFAKIFLYIFVSIFFFPLIFFIPKIGFYKILYLIIFIGGIFNIFFPTWYFQGIEKLSLTALFTFFVRLIFTILVFVLIKEKDDYLLYPVATLAGQFVIALASILLITKKYKIRLFFPGIRNITNILKKGWKIFVTTVVVNLYTTTNFVLLGFLSSDKQVGIYSAAYKIIILFMSVISAPLGQALYPSIGYIFSKSYKAGIKKLYKTFHVVLILTLSLSILILLSSKYLILIIFGNEFKESIVTLRILSFLPLIIGLSNIWGIQGLLNLKKDGYVNLVTMIGAGISLILNFVLIPLYQANGTALSWVITEIIITILMLYGFVKYTDFYNDVRKYAFNFKEILK